MVKITIENDGTKTELAGRCIFAVVIDPEGDGDMATALTGNTSPYEMTDAIGISLGKQIKALVPSFSDQLRLIDLLAKAVTRGAYGDLKETRTEIKIE
jgi:hypothetical protein